MGHTKDSGSGTTAIVTAAGLAAMIGWFGGYSLGGEGREYVKDRELSIHICQTALPRNQFCGAKWETFVKDPSEAIHISASGKETTLKHPVRKEPSKL